MPLGGSGPGIPWPTGTARLSKRDEEAQPLSGLLADLEPVRADDIPWHGLDHSIAVDLPARPALWLVPSANNQDRMRRPNETAR